MPAINATNARKNLYRLIKEVGESHEPITITGKTAPRFSSMKTIGMPFRKLYTFCPFPVWQVPSAKGSRLPWTSAIRK